MIEKQSRQKQQQQEQQHGQDKKEVVLEGSRVASLVTGKRSQVLYYKQNKISQGLKNWCTRDPRAFVFCSPQNRAYGYPESLWG